MDDGCEKVEEKPTSKIESKEDSSTTSSGELDSTKVENTPRMARAAEFENLRICR